jgi:hypothetical protein
LRFTRFGNCVTIFENVQLNNNLLQTMQVRLNDCGFVGEGESSVPSIYFGKSKITEFQRQNSIAAQDPIIAGRGMIKGQIRDMSSKSALEYVSLTVKLNGVTKATCISDLDGQFEIKNLLPGTYDLYASYVGYKSTLIKEIEVSGEEVRFINFTMEQSYGTTLSEVQVSYKKQLVDPGGVNGYATSSKEIMAMSSRSVNSMSVDAMPSFRGARADATSYYIDGVRVSNVPAGNPSNAINQIDIISGGVPASLSDKEGATNAFANQQRGRMYEMASVQAANRTRNNFRDYAYWVPNLVTDEKGEAHMSISFPDNITRWRSFILAMDEHLC